jgi:prepilin-type N-terminal cleavage/methylation domain-containing protein
MFFETPKSQRGFTLIELLVVIAIIAVLASVVLFAVNDARSKGRDAGRKVQVLEVLKALEFYYSVNGSYPNILPAGTGNTLDQISNTFYGPGKSIIKLPDDANTEYYYCTTGNRASMTLAVDTENDKGGSNFCSITRGVGPTFGCIAWMATNAADSCLSRF